MATFPKIQRVEDYVREKNSIPDCAGASIALAKWLLAEGKLLIVCVDDEWIVENTNNGIRERFTSFENAVMFALQRLFVQQSMHAVASELNQALLRVMGAV